MKKDSEKTEMERMADLWVRWLDSHAGLVRTPAHMREFARCARAAADGMDSAVDMAERTGSFAVAS